MNVVTTVGKPSSTIPLMGLFFGTQSVETFQEFMIQERELFNQRIKLLRPSFTPRQAWRIHYQIYRLLRRNKK